MAEPKDLPHTIAGRELVAKVPDIRAQILTLANGETIPWHYHSSVHDIIVCISGVTVVRTREPTARHDLAPGEHCVVSPNTAHEVSAEGPNGCRFTIVQGVGKHDYNQIGSGTGSSPEA